MINQTFHNGVTIPILGFGLFKLDKDINAEEAALTALQTGYRMLDTATVYRNEEAVGSAIKKSGLKREDLFITTKLWSRDIVQGRVAEAYQESLDKLELDYVDLYLIHWPVDGYLEAWHKLEELYRQKKMRAIGVSNFTKSHLDHLLHNSSEVPVINQVECHPYLQQESYRQYLAAKGIVMQAWGPLGQAKSDLLTNEAIKAIGDKYGKSNAQVMLRWNIQRGVNVIPKSQTASRIKENFEVFDFSLNDDDMEQISLMDQDRHYGTDPNNQEAVDNLAKL